MQVSGGSVAYSITGTSPDNDIRNPKGITTTSGTWNVHGIAIASSTSIGDVSHAINTTNKFTYKQVYDSSNNRLMISQGTAASDTWKTVADFGAGDAIVTVTPS